MLLVSWNLAGRVKRLEEQAERLLSLRADAICLQEITRSTLPRWRALLNDAGYLGIEHGDLDSGRSRSLAVLIACREPIEPVTVDAVPWPERVLAVRMATGPELVNVHSPISPKPHLTVSACVAVQSCCYEHGWRKDGLSDHSALIARLQVAGLPPSTTRTRAPRAEPPRRYDGMSALASGPASHRRRCQTWMSVSIRHAAAAIWQY
jgi:hypothetical protein